MSKIAFGVFLSAFGIFASDLLAANYYYDPSAANSSQWFSNSWATPTNTGPYNQAWNNNAGNNNVANFTANSSDTNYTVMLGGQTVNFGSGGLVWNPTGSSVTLVLNESSASALSFNGGTVNAGPNGNYAIRTFQAVSGNFTLTQGFFDIFSSSAYAGTATVNAGFLYFNSLASTSTSSNVQMNGGTLWFRGRVGVRQFGALSGSSGAMSLQADGTTGVDLSVSSLSGAASIGVNASASAVNSTLTVNQASNTTYSGNIAGENNQHRLGLVKSGSGTLTLNGSSVVLTRESVVSAGTLLINAGSTRNFQSASGSTAIRVSDGGTLGGTSTLTISGGDDVLVESGGQLSAGNGIGSAGRTTFNFSAGGALDLTSAMAEEGWLKFDLGTDVTAGTTYDQIRITGGDLDIGTALLDFDDFSFNLVAGFGAGTYTLFNSANLVGSLGAGVDGRFDDDYAGTLSVSGNDVLLTVSYDPVPEPGTAVLSLLGLGVVVFLMKRRKYAP